MVNVGKYAIHGSYGPWCDIVPLSFIFWFSENFNSSKKVVRWKKDPCLIARTCRLQAWKQRGVASLVSQDVVNDSSVHTIRYLVQVLYTFFCLTSSFQNWYCFTGFQLGVCQIPYIYI